MLCHFCSVVAGRFERVVVMIVVMVNASLMLVSRIERNVGERNWVRCCGLNIGGLLACYCRRNPIVIA